ncbi:ADP-ribosylation factor-like protein 4C [Armadillidium vulgare]|nr:ADP-ribosylation factor-like protein 4C [Armadillidium vulgare]
MSLTPYPSQRWDRTLTLTRKSDSSNTAESPSKRLSDGQQIPEAGCPGQVPGNGGLTRTVTGVVKRRKHVVLLGLDGSGKTTILMRLKFGCQVSTVPTIGFNHEKVWGGGFRWSAWDVGGGEKLRPLWVMYARATDGIVFVVDASSNNDFNRRGKSGIVESYQGVKIVFSVSKHVATACLSSCKFPRQILRKRPRGSGNRIRLIRTMGGRDYVGSGPRMRFDGGGIRQRPPHPSDID